MNQDKQNYLKAIAASDQFQAKINEWFDDAIKSGLHKELTNLILYKYIDHPEFLIENLSIIEGLAKLQLCNLLINYIAEHDKTISDSKL